MFVKVNPAYAGAFGCYDDKLKTVHTKRADDPPFSVPDNDAKGLIENGVLIASDGRETKASTIEPDEPDTTPEIDAETPEISAEAPTKKAAPKKPATKK